MAEKNRELSQFGQFLEINDSNVKIGIATTAMPFVGIGTTNPTSKFFVNGNAQITGILTVAAVRGGGQIGIASNSTYLGLTTQFNFVGVGITITPQYNPTTGITTINLIGGSGGLSPGGGESQVQYYSEGILAGSPNFTFNGQSINVAGVTTSSRFISTVASGTAPLSVASSTVVTNFNADYLDGYNPQVGNIGNSIVLRDVNGNFQAGIITATTFVGGLTGNVTATTGSSRIDTLNGTNVYYTNGFINTGIVTTLTSTNTTLNRVNISGIVTVGNNPVLIGVANSTGTQAQRLQVEGKGYFSDNLGIGNTNPGSRLTVTGDGFFSGIVTATQYIGIVSYSTLSGTSTISNYATNAGVATFASISGFSTTSGIATNVIGGIGSISNLRVSGIATFVGLTTFASVGIGTTLARTNLDLTGAYTQNIITIPAVNIDCSLSNYFVKSISGVTTFTVSNVPTNRVYSLTLELTATSGSVTWFSGVVWPGNTAPGISTGKTHLFMFVTDDGGTRWRGASLLDYTT